MLNSVDISIVQETDMKKLSMFNIFIYSISKTPAFSSNHNCPKLMSQN